MAGLKSAICSNIAVACFADLSARRCARSFLPLGALIPTARGSPRSQCSWEPNLSVLDTACFLYGFNSSIQFSLVYAVDLSKGSNDAVEGMDQGRVDHGFRLSRSSCDGWSWVVSLSGGEGGRRLSLRFIWVSPDRIIAYAVALATRYGGEARLWGPLRWSRLYEWARSPDPEHNG
jgi:hypothetical protein